MPPIRISISLTARCLSACRPAVAALAVLGLLLPASRVTAEPQAVRSQTVELHYRLAKAGPAAEVELWYTRDRGTTWQKYGDDQDGRSPLLFIAPAEGLYGLTLIVRDGQRVSAAPPKPFDQPQRWVFVDYTPPLAQWLAVEPADDFASRRTVQLRWTAHDDNFDSRPIALAWQSSVDQQWHEIASDVPNTGRYDWAVPAGAAGQVTLKLIVRDRGGHVVERLFGPVPVAAWKASASTGPAAAAENAAAGSKPPATAPAVAAASQPATAIDLETRKKAEERYRQGSWHLVRGQYALAAERFKEALALDPHMLPAMNDLAGIYYLQEDYDRAADLYTNVLAADSRHVAAMRGAALAYVAKKQYARSRDMLTRMLAANDADTGARLDLGDVLFMMGDRDGARQQWNRAMTADASAADIVQKARRRLDLYGPTAPAEQAAAAGRR